jgi:hypothetical protein
MINPEIPLIGRQLMLTAFGAVSAKALQARNVALVEQEASRVLQLQQDARTYEDISFELSGRIIDMRTKKPEGGEDARLAYMANQNMIKAHVRYNNAVSSYNKRLADQKAKSSFKLADLRRLF